MIISRGRRYIFVHIPKTGGTSLATALEARAMADDILIGDTPKALRRKNRLKTLTPAGRLWKHATLADIDGIVTQKELDTFCLFTLTRNPWDRAVSYYHWLRDQSFDHPAVGLAQSLEFTPFISHPQTLGALNATPVRHYLTDASGNAHEGHVIRLEHLADDLAPIEDHLGFRLEIPRVNRSDRKADYRDYYTDQTAEMIARACAEDIARFGYAF